MVDLNAPLGRPIPTTRNILEVIRPQLRFAALVGPVLLVGLQRDPDGVCFDGGDDHAEDAMVDSLVEDALRNVGEWVGDMALDPETFGMVFCKERTGEFIREALLECWNGNPSEAVLDVLALDEGVCESIGLALKALAQVDVTLDRLTGFAAGYFGRV